MKKKIKYFRLKVCIFIVQDAASSSSFALLRGAWSKNVIPTWQQHSLWKLQGCRVAASSHLASSERMISAIPPWLPVTWKPVSCAQVNTCYDVRIGLAVTIVHRCCHTAVEPRDRRVCGRLWEETAHEAQSPRNTAASRGIRRDAQTHF